jgi:hypothetical protein
MDALTHALLSFKSSQQTQLKALQRLQELIVREEALSDWLPLQNKIESNGPSGSLLLHALTQRLQLPLHCLNSWAAVSCRPDICKPQNSGSTSPSSSKPSPSCKASCYYTEEAPIWPANGPTSK